MGFKSHHNRNMALTAVLIGCLSVSFLAVQGCSSLRKKFTRKKKKDKTHSREFIPVLEPVDYAPAIRSAEERYKYYYGLWQVWSRDLLQSIDRDDSDKRQKYLLEQAIEQLTEMQKWITGDAQAQLSGTIGDLRDIRALYNKPPALRNMIRLKGKILLAAKKIRNRFAPGPALSYKE